MARRTITPEPDGVLETTIYEGAEAPDTIGSIEPSELSFLGEWKRHQTRGPQGFYWRMGVKENIRDSQGDPSTAVIYYVSPFTKEGHVRTPQIEAMYDQELRAFLEIHTRILSMRYNSVTIAAVNPTEDMLHELIKLTL